MVKFFIILLAAMLMIREGQTQKIKSLTEAIEFASTNIEAKAVKWRRAFHEHPELGNREFKTAKIIADHLRSLGLEVKEGIAYTGVVGLLKGYRPGPVIGLRADMDALPVEERNDLPFASKDKGIYNGQEVPVMHACGHDAHMAILMSVAEILAMCKYSWSLWEDKKESL